MGKFSIFPQKHPELREEEEKMKSFLPLPAASQVVTKNAVLMFWKSPDRASRKYFSLKEIRSCRFYENLDKFAPASREAGFV